MSFEAQKQTMELKIKQRILEEEKKEYIKELENNKQILINKLSEIKEVCTTCYYCKHMLGDRYFEICLINGENVNSIRSESNYDKKKKYNIKFDNMIYKCNNWTPNNKLQEFIISNDNDNEKIEMDIDRYYEEYEDIIEKREKKLIQDNY